MTGLADLVEEIVVIKTTTGEFSVSGLSLEAIGTLVKRYKDDLKDLFTGNIDYQNLITQSPGLVAEAIALASGEPGEVARVKTLPVGVQLIAMEAIWQLSIVDDEAILKMIRKLTGLKEKLVTEKLPLRTGKKS